MWGVIDCSNPKPEAISLSLRFLNGKLGTFVPGGALMRILVTEASAIFKDTASETKIRGWSDR